MQPDEPFATAATVEAVLHDDGWGSTYAVSCSACGVISTFAGDPKTAREAATNDCEAHRIWHGTRV